MIQNKKEILDTFGHILIEKVRDSSYIEFEKIIKGTLNSKSSKLIREQTKHFDSEQMESLGYIIRDTIDSTLHHFLWMIEQSEEYDIIQYLRNDKSQYVSLRDISDGLCGELYSEEGWIEKYSKYPPSIK